jgi:bacterioferritin-associated ferredoxin
MTTMSNASSGTDCAGCGVNRCLCFDVSFERLKEIADRTGGGLLEAHRQTGCGARCGLCIPYIQVMLKTGETDLPVMWAEEFEAHGVNPGRVQRIQKMLAGAVAMRSKTG